MEINSKENFVFPEILEPPKEDATSTDNTIVVGSHVRIKANVSTPRYKWGSAVRGSVGVVTAINDNGDITVDFPQQFSWTGQLSEMELVSNFQGNSQSVPNESSIGGDLIEDWSRFEFKKFSFLPVLRKFRSYFRFQMYTISNGFIQRVHGETFVGQVDQLLAKFIGWHSKKLDPVGNARKCSRPFADHNC